MFCDFAVVIVVVDDDVVVVVVVVVRVGSAELTLLRQLTILE